MSRFAVILLAAGRSSRFGDPHTKKPFISLEGRPVWMHSAERFRNRADVCQTIVVVSPDDRDDFQQRFGGNLVMMDLDLVEGGAERADSVRAGLSAVRDGATHVAVHDAARPLVADTEIDAVFAAATEHDAAILATPVTATLKRVVNGRIAETVPRDGLWAAQTPQAFRLDLLRRAHAGAEDATDDAGLVERLGESVAVVEGSAENLKVTTQDDLRLAATLLAARQPAKAGRKPPPDLENELWG